MFDFVNLKKKSDKILNLRDSFFFLSMKKGFVFLNLSKNKVNKYAQRAVLNVCISMGLV